MGRGQPEHPALSVSPLCVTAVMWLAMAAWGCGPGSTSNTLAAEPAPASEPPGPLPAGSFYVPGEIMEFDFSFQGVTVGRAVLAAGEPGTRSGRPVLVVRSEVASAGLAKLVKTIRDDVKTWIDLGTGNPIEHQADFLFGDKRILLQSRFEERKLLIEYERNGPPRRKTIFRLPAGVVVHDSHSSLGALRAWTPRPGERVSFHGVSGRRMWLVELRATSRETIRTAMGVYPAVRLDGTAKRLTTRLTIDEKAKLRTFTIWLSEDANRLPLRVAGHTEYGDMSIELTRYHRPTRYISSN